MAKLMRELASLGSEQSGQDLVEYALLAGLIAVAAGLFVPEMSASMVTIYERLASKLVQASS